MKGIYIHIPFCMSKCLYCDFVSMEGGDKKAYIAALKKEIRFYDAEHAGTVDSIFFGGGTPSSVLPIYIESVMDTLKKSFEVQDDAEITIEANPGTVDREKLLAYKKMGINRISFGLQSANDDELVSLGRIHTFEEFLESYELARNAGFENINIDLMFGLPNQDLRDFDNSVRKVLELEPEHISCYALKIEKGTEFYKKYYGSTLMPGEKQERQMYHTARTAFENKGYVHYETSNFAKPGFECRHNLKYWTGEEYLGFGVAAHSYFFDKRKRYRQNNISDIEKYIRDIENDVMPIDEEVKLTEKDIQDEYIMLHLRLNTGIVFEEYLNLFGMDFEKDFSEQIEKLQENGLIRRDEKGIYSTPKGFDLQNTMISMFL